MNRRLLHAAIIATLLGTAQPAQAKAIEIWGSGLAGAGYGDGETDKDFFNWAGGAAVGVEVGVKFLFLAGYIDYLRFFGGDTGANLVSINVGSEGSFELGGDLELVLRLVGTFYIGTLDRASRNNEDTGLAPPSEKVKTRGLGGRGGIGLRYRFAKIFSVGVTPLVGYHYFIGGADQDIGSENSSGWDLQGLGYLRVGLGI